MKALLSVSFGTSYEQTRMKTIDAIDAQLATAFSERAFYSAWTSGIIVAKVRREKGEHHDTLEEAFARMSADGVDEVVIATTCLMQGGETGKIEAAARTWAAGGEGRRACVAKPLLADEGGRHVVAQALCREFSSLADDEALLLMGHGSHGAAAGCDTERVDANAVYGQMQDELHALGFPRFFVATVEGTPTFEDALQLIDGCGPSRVYLAPFMIVAGDHATNDLAGADDDSWKSRLEARGYRTATILRGLGEYGDVQRLVCERAREAEEILGGGIVHG